VETARLAAAQAALRDRPTGSGQVGKRDL
jgi:hypothetical protein